MKPLLPLGTGKCFQQRSVFRGATPGPQAPTLLLLLYGRSPGPHQRHPLLRLGELLLGGWGLPIAPEPLSPSGGHLRERTEGASSLKVALVGLPRDLLVYAPTMFTFHASGSLGLHSLRST